MSFYLRSKEALGGLYEVNNPYVNAMFAAVAAGVVAWALHEAFYSRLRPRFGSRAVIAGEGALAAGAGVYVGIVLTYTRPDERASEPGRRGTRGCGSGVGRFTRDSGARSWTLLRRRCWSWQRSQD